MKWPVFLRAHAHLGAGLVISIPILWMSKLRPETVYGQMVCVERGTGGAWSFVAMDATHQG